MVMRDWPGWMAELLFCTSATLRAPLDFQGGDIRRGFACLPWRSEEHVGGASCVSVESAVIIEVETAAVEFLCFHHASLL